MPRATMTAIIATVSTLVADATNAVFTADAVQAVCDRHKRRERYLELRPDPTYTGTSVNYLAYVAPCTDWETDAALVDSTYTALTPASSDYSEGRWTFAASTPPPVRLSGTTYDVYAAAADLCIQRVSLTSDQYNYSDQGQSLSRAQVPINWRSLAADYRARRRVWMG